MPMYEFRCLNCGHTFIESLKLSELDAAKPRCPSCGGLEVIQIVEAAYVRTARKA